MSKCKILVDCLSDYVGQNIYSVLGQNNGRPPPPQEQEHLLHTALHDSAFGRAVKTTALRLLCYRTFTSPLCNPLI